MSITETCTVRPELVEFQKTSDEFLSIVAYPSDGFKFTKTAYTTADAGDLMTDISYDAANLADLYAHTIFAEQLEVDTIANVSLISMIADGTGVIDMNNGNIIDVGLFETTPNVDGSGNNSIRIHENIMDLNMTGEITNVHEVRFFELGEASVMTIQNDSIVFGAADGLINMTGGNIENVQRMSLMMDGSGTIDARAGTVHDVALLDMTASGVIDLNQGSIVDVARMELGNIVMSDDNMIYHAYPDGEINLEDVLFSNNTVSNVTNLHFVESTDSHLDMASGKMTNVTQFDLMEDSTGEMYMHGGKVDFGTVGGRLEMKSAGAVANIGDMTLSTNHITNHTGIVRVEGTEFEDTQIRTLDIQNLSGESSVTVMDAVFTEQFVTVGNVSTDTVTPKDSNILILQGADTDTSTIRVERKDTNAPAGNGAPIRISNVATPVADTDAANKGYVKEAVEQNIQGLKPKKACDVSLFATDWTNKTFSNVDGVDNSLNKYFFAHKQSYDANIGDTSDLYLFYTNHDETFDVDGRVFTHDELNTSHEAEVNNISPSIPRLRILVNGLNADTYVAANVELTEDQYSSAFQTYFGMPLSRTNVNVAGLNGIWEIAKQMDESDNLEDGSVDFNPQFQLNIGSINYYCVKLQRSMDMNQNHEVMNGAYVYVKGGTSSRSNMAYVVSNNDPLTISETTGLTQALNESDVMVMKPLEWVDFNSVNYELAYVNTTGSPPALEDIAADFRNGGIAMKYDAYDEKKVMVDATMLRYESDVAAEKGLSLHIKGNVDFDLQDADAHMTSYVNRKLFVNGSEFTSNISDGTSSMHTDYIVCNTATCESDRTLKKNITTLTNGLELVSKLNAVTFNWNTDLTSEQTEYGFIAQEVESEFPSLVRTDPYTGIKSVDYQKITSLLASAVQELASKIL